jgi:signal transduction histidine kinase
MSRNDGPGILRALAQPVTYLGAAMLVFIYCAVAYLLIADRKDDFNDAVRDGGNLARIIDQSYSHIFKSIDATLLLLRESYQQNTSAFNLPVLVRDPSIRNELIFDFTIYDASGRIVDTSYSNSIVGGDRRNLEGFRVHANSTEDQLFVSNPYMTKVSGRWAILVTRRITKSDGTFAGVIAAFLDPIELGKRIAKLDLGPGGAFALVSFDGFMYTRVADGKIVPESIGQKLLPKTNILKYRGPNKRGYYWNSPGVIDGISRLISYQAIESFPLTVVVGVSEAEVYRHANENRLIYLGIAALLTVAILIAIYLGATRERKLFETTSKLQQAKDSLVQANQELETRVVDRTTELAQEMQRREEVQIRLAQTNQELEMRVADRTNELAQEMRRREEAQISLVQAQKMEAVGQLTAGIAHDFNNLLAVIQGSLGFVEGAAMRGLTAEPELIDAALRATRRGSELVRRLLAFARQSPLLAQPTIVDQLVMDTLRLLQHSLGEKIEIVTRLDAMAAIVSVDRNQLANALLNLALNARDAMAEGGQLTIATTCKPTRWAATEGPIRWPTGEEICITVSDTGVGMTEEVRSRVYEPFFTTKVDGLGTGLGLSMVHGFVEQTGGHIEIESLVGQGTTITICLPRIDPAEKTGEPNAVLASAASGREQTVLLVEDDPDVRIVTAAQLKQMGYKVHAVSNGMEALDLVVSPADIDIILTDVVLPGGLDGVALVKEAMQARPDIGVLCMSGYDPTQKHSKWLKMQNIEFLEKPFTSARLAQALNAAIAR